jgi:hypothetical protein
MAIPTSAIELLQVIPKLVHSALFSPPDMVAKAVDIRHDIGRKHEQILARLRVQIRHVADSRRHTGLPSLSV